MSISNIHIIWFLPQFSWFEHTFGENEVPQVAISIK
jgi:hypothetical protein